MKYFLFEFPTSYDNRQRKTIEYGTREQHIHNIIAEIVSEIAQTAAAHDKQHGTSDKNYQTGLIS